jgi:hypothetical protein
VLQKDFLGSGDWQEKGTDAEPAESQIQMRPGKGTTSSRAARIQYQRGFSR